MMTAATKPAPGSTETARSEASPAASEQPTPDTIVAAESTEPAPAPAAKKPHNKRKTVRHERSREFWNPLNFFAWGSNGARRSF
jgi:hypothetical protein